MKYLSYLINFVLLLLIVVVSIREGLPTDGETLLVVVLATAFALINIGALYFSTGSQESWIALFLKRKALEEQQKIELIKQDLKK